MDRMAPGGRSPQLDRRFLVAALSNDLATLRGCRPFALFAVLFVLAASYGVAVRGAVYLADALLIAVLGGGISLVAWWCGWHPLATDRPDPVRAPRAEAAIVLVLVVAVLLWSARGTAAGTLLGLVAAGAGVVLVRRAGYGLGELAPLGRSWRPFLPLFALVAAPKLIAAGPAVVLSAPLWLGSGILQQLAMQIGATARLEALAGRRDVAAIGSSFLFAALHVTLNLPQAGGSWVLAAAAALVFQAPIGLLFAFAYQRHRAPAALGALHGLAIA